MQGVEGIIKTIINEAELDAQATREQNEQYIEGLRKKAEAEVASVRKTQMASAMEKGFESERRAMTMLDVKKRRDDLAVKRGLVDEAFQRAVDAINHLDEKSYRAFIEALLVEASDTGDEQIIAAPGDDRIDESLLESANSMLEASGKKGNLSLSQEKREMSGGFVLLTGGIETNCSLSMLVKQQYALIEKEVAKVLFAEQP